MKARMRWRVGLLGLTALLAGCQGSPKAYRYIEAMNAERRALQDRVYDLEYELDVLDGELADARAENDRLRKEVGDDGRGASPRGRSSPPSVPRTTPSRRDAPVEHDLSPPVIDGGEPADDEPAAPEMRAPARADARDDDARGAGIPTADEPAVLPPPVGEERGASRSSPGPRVVATAATIASNDRHVVRVAIDPGRSGGADFDGKRGDDGVTVLVQPKNGAGQIVLDPGAISVAVLDPNRAADEARVARWDLDAQQVAKLAEDPEQHKGFKLHFAWPEQPPSSSLLRLYVRFANADGEHFDAEQEIHIELPEGARGGRPGWRAER